MINFVSFTNTLISFLIFRASVGFSYPIKLIASKIIFAHFELNALVSIAVFYKSIGMDYDYGLAHPIPYINTLNMILHESSSIYFFLMNSYLDFCSCFSYFNNDY